MAVAQQPPRLAVVQAVDDSAVLKKLSTLDRYLPLWIGLAMSFQIRTMAMQRASPTMITPVR
jgi:hypothetical protein